MHLFNLKRRTSIRTLVGLAMAGLAQPLQLIAAEWNKSAFDARTIEAAIKAIGAGSAKESGQIRVKTPEIAENGSIVPIEVSSEIPGTQMVYILVDKNPQPLTASFEFVAEAIPFISTRIKMNESSTVRFIVKAGNEFFATHREIKVTIGGCGA